MTNATATSTATAPSAPSLSVLAPDLPKYQKHTRLASMTIDLIINKLPLPVVEALKTHTPHLVLAGGPIRSVVMNQPIRDIDLFYNTDALDNCFTLAKALMKELVAGFKSSGFPLKGRLKYDVMQTSARAYTIYIHDLYEEGTTKEKKTERLIPDVQVIQDEFVTPIKCPEKFDFGACQSVVWFDNPGFEERHTPLFWHDVDKNTLTFNPLHEGNPTSIKRLYKYLKEYGFRITYENLMALLDDIARRRPSGLGKGTGTS